MTGPEEKNLNEDHSEDDIFLLIKEIREKLEDSPKAIFPFIESCTRNADPISQLYILKIAT